MAKEKPVESTYRVLSEIEHIRARPGMYVGSVSQETNVQWVYDVSTNKMVKQEITIVPGLIKIFSEILDNAIDESKRTPLLNSIRVEFGADNSISITDNGRGFPCEIHSETGKYIAETVFTNLRAGSNFNDDEDQSLIGTNGVGSSLTVVLSNTFTVETADGKKLYKQTYSDGMRKISAPKITDSDKHYTKITFTPDYQYFGYEVLDDDHILRMTKRVVDAAACNPKVKFYVNGDRIMAKNFDDYIEMYLADGETYVYDQTDKWAVGISESDDGFEQVSFVNSVETYQGGEHTKYAINQIVDEVRAYIKKKHKVEVSPADIRNHLRIYVSCEINRPRFSSQTKENMISLPSEWKSTWAVPEKFINKLVKSEIILSILERAEAKANAALAAELRKASKDQNKSDPRKVEKFSDAIERVERHRTICYLSEGDSASKSIQGGRGDNPYIGSFPLKGKILNVRDKDVSRVLGLDKKKEKEQAGKKVAPNEIQKIMSILGLSIGEPVEFVPFPDGQWVELEVGGKTIVVNEYDSIQVDGEWVKVSSLLADDEGAYAATVPVK